MFRIIITFTLAVFVSGCAGRMPHPVFIQDVSDYSNSCNVLKRELEAIQNDMTHLGPYRDKTVRNVGFGIGGFFFAPLWLFIDFKKDEDVEYRAYERRYNFLLGIAQDKKCKFSHN